MKQFLKQFTASGIDVTHRFTETITGRIFRSARMQITLVYALTMMTVIIFFSVGLFQVTLHNVRLAKQPRPPVLITDAVSGLVIGVQQPMIRPEMERQIRTQVIADIKENIIILDGLLFVIVTFLGYTLAGFTLRPIAVAYEKQKKFVADASHDLRTPLAIMQSELELALRVGAYDSKVVIESTKEEVERLSVLVENLLVLARVDQVAQTQKENFAIDVLFKKLTPPYAKLAEDKGLTYKVQMNPASVVGHSGQIERAIRNILTNAINYTTHGSVTVTGVVVGKKYRITVSDTGKGITPQALSRVFDRFYREDQSRNDVGSTGLGLSIAKEIIEAEGGTIQLMSELTVGTVVTIILPCKK